MPLEAGNRRCIRCGAAITEREPLLFCADCRPAELARERQRVANHNARAVQAGLRADLSLAQWMETLADFNGLCAYCQERPYEHLEHFIPLTAGGGTTISNVVPACGRCNWSKGSDDPDLPQPSFFSSDPRERVRRYLAARVDDDPGWDDEDWG